MSAFADELKRERKRLHMSQQQFARAVGVHPMSVSKWERGESMPRLAAAILALARTLKRLPKGQGRYGTKGGRPKKEG